MFHCHCLVSLRLLGPCRVEVLHSLPFTIHAVQTIKTLDVMRGGSARLGSTAIGIWQLCTAQGSMRIGIETSNMLPLALHVSVFRPVRGSHPKRGAETVTTRYLGRVVPSRLCSPLAWYQQRFQILTRSALIRKRPTSVFSGLVHEFRATTERLNAPAGVRQ